MRPSAAGRPRGDGPHHRALALPESLTPFLDQLTVITQSRVEERLFAGNHATANSAFLSAAKAKMTEGTDYELGTTVDQIAAQQIGKETPLPSLELCMDLLTTVGDCDNGFACAIRTISPGLRRPRRFRRRPTRVSSSSDCSAMAAAPPNAAPR